MVKDTLLPGGDKTEQLILNQEDLSGERFGYDSGKCDGLHENQNQDNDKQNSYISGIFVNIRVRNQHIGMVVCQKGSGVRHLIAFIFQNYRRSMGGEEMLHNFRFTEEVNRIGVDQFVIGVSDEYLIVVPIIISQNGMKQLRADIHKNDSEYFRLLL